MPALALSDYVVPWSARFKAIQCIMAGSRATCSTDMALILAAAPVAPRVEDIDCLPSTGPVLITHNHYSRRGMGAWWATSLALTNCRTPSRAGACLDGHERVVLPRPVAQRNHHAAYPVGVRSRGARLGIPADAAR